MGRTRWLMVSMMGVAALAGTGCGSDDSKKDQTSSGKSKSGAAKHASLNSIRTLKEVPGSEDMPSRVKGSDVPVPQFAQTVARDVDQWWQEVFQRSKLDYDPATVKFVDSTAEGKCGTAKSTETFYCKEEDTLYLGNSFVQGIYSQYSDAGLLTVEAGLVSQHAQNLLGVWDAVDAKKATLVNAQLQNVCFAGAYLASVGRRALLEDGDVEEGSRIAAESSDPPGTPNEQKSNGTPEERKQALTRGFENGASACTLDVTG